jgi:hypothetical protein
MREMRKIYRVLVGKPGEGRGEERCMQGFWW